MYNFLNGVFCQRHSRFVADIKTRNVPRNAELNSLQVGIIHTTITSRENYVCTNCTPNTVAVDKR